MEVQPKDTMEPIQRIKDQIDVQAKFKLDESRHNQSLVAINDLKNSNIQAMQSLVRYLDGKVTRTEVINQLESIATPDVELVVQAVERLAEKIPPQLDLSSLESGLKALEEQLKLIPKENIELPEQKESVTVTNLDEIDFTTLEDAIKGIKITTPAPIVNVSPTDVAVDVDLKPIQKGLSDLLKTVKDLKFPEPKATDLTKVEKKLDEANKHLKVISEKKMGGGGGGNSTPYIDETGKPLNVILSENGSIPVEITNGATEEQQLAQGEVLEEIEHAVQAIAAARGIASDLRVTILGGGVTISSGTVTTVTTVTGITNIGGTPANQLVPSNQNLIATIANVNNIGV